MCGTLNASEPRITPVCLDRYEGRLHQVDIHQPALQHNALEEVLETYGQRRLQRASTNLHVAPYSKSWRGSPVVNDRRSRLDTSTSTPPFAGCATVKGGELTPGVLRASSALDSATRRRLERTVTLRRTRVQSRRVREGNILIGDAHPPPSRWKKFEVARTHVLGPGRHAKGRRRVSLLPLSDWRERHCKPWTTRRAQGGDSCTRVQLNRAPNRGIQTLDGDEGTMTVSIKHPTSLAISCLDPSPSRPARQI